jgi:hypothetical protein
VVKETDSKSVGLVLRRFESCCRRFLFFLASPNIVSHGHPAFLLAAAQRRPAVRVECLPWHIGTYACGLSCVGSNPAVDAFFFLFWLHQILCPTAILHSCWLLHSAARRSESNAFHGISVRTLVDRLSANVPLNFSLYIIFFVISSTFHPLFFYLPQRFPLNSPPISHYTIKYHFLYILFIYYKFFIY